MNDRDNTCPNPDCDRDDCRVHCMTCGGDIADLPPYGETSVCVDCGAPA